MDEEATEPFLHPDPNQEAYLISNPERNKKMNKKKDIIINIKRGINEEVKSIMMKGFIKKVYGLLMLLFSLTFGICIFAHYNKTFQYLLSFRTFIFLDLLIFLGLSIYLLAYPKTIYKVPLNYFILLAYVLIMSWPIASIAYQYSLKNLFVSYGLTITTLIIITIYCMYTERNYKLLTKIFLIAMILFLISLVIYIFVRTSILYLSVNALCLIILAIYLINDTDVILTTRNGTMVLVDAYIPAAIILYIDLVNIFLSYLGFSNN